MTKGIGKIMNNVSNDNTPGTQISPTYLSMYHDELNKIFKDEIAKKNSWGKNEVNTLFLECTNKALLNTLAKIL
jgi:hypothetical protein